MAVGDIMIFHNLKGMPFHDIAQNIMAISTYSTKTPHHDIAQNLMAISTYLAKTPHH